MAYKRYIKRDGKVYGPYIYNSKRVNGKVVSTYVGSVKDDNSGEIKLKTNKTYINKPRLFLFFTLLILSIFTLFLLSNLVPTGKVTLQLSPVYTSGESIAGNLNLALKQGELISADTQVKVQLGAQEKTISLSDLMSENPVSGNFYVENTGISGSGLGYGAAGERVVSPKIDFTLLITKEESSSRQPLTENEPAQEQPTETQPTRTLLTGATVTEKTIDGVVSSDNPFIYDLNGGETAEITKAEINGTEVDKNLISLTQDGLRLTFTTNYSAVESGFGQEFISNGTYELNVDLSKFDILAENGNLNAVLSYNNTEIASGTKKIVIEKTPENLTNLTETNVTNVTRQILGAGETSESGDNEWRMFGRFLNHTGYTNTYAPIIGVGNVTTFARNFLSSSPTIAGSYVYIGSSDKNFYQLNASNISQQIANFTTGNSITASPAVANGFVYIGSSDKNVYQLNASNISQQIANYTTGGAIYSSPAVANGYVYIGSYDNKFYQLNASNISQQIDNFTTGDHIYYSSPAVANGYVYIGSEDNQTYQLNASNVSQKIANFTTGNVVHSSPAVAYGYVYIGSSDNNVYQLNASNISQQITNFTTNGYIFSSPAVAGSYVYVGSTDNHAYQLNASNISQQVANYTTNGNIYSSPAVAGNYVFIGSDDNQIYQLNASNVSQKITNYTTGNSISASSPAVSSGYVYIASGYDKFYQFGNYVAPPSSDSGANEWRMFHRYLNHTGYTNEYAPIIGAGNVTTFATDGEIYSSPTIANGYIYLGSGGPASSRGNFYQLNASNVNQQIANYTIGYGVGGVMFSSAAVAGSYVYVGGMDHKVYQLNASNISQSIANFTTLNWIESSPAVSNGYVYIGSYDGNVYQLNATDISQKIASFGGYDITESSPAVANDYVYIGTTDSYSTQNSIYQLNATNVSQQIANYTTPREIDSSPAVAGSYVYVGCSDGNVYQFNASNVSQKIANFTTGAGDWIYSSPAIANGYVYIGSYYNYAYANKSIYQLNATNISQQIANFTTKGNSVSSPIVTDKYVFVGSSDGKLYQLNATNISQQITSYSGAGGTLGSSPAIANGYVYYGSHNQVFQIGYSIGPQPDLASPSDDSIILADNVTFNCSATSDSNLANISLYITDRNNQNFALNQTTIVTGTSNSTTWTLYNLSQLGVTAEYTWNCLVYDNNSNSNWAGNYSFSIPPYLNCNDTSGNWTIANNITITQNYTCNNIIVTNNSVLTFNSTAAGNALIVLNTNNLNVTIGSKISADGTGYLTGQGPGYLSGKAASHGGQAGGNTKLPYGSSWQPTTLGSGTDSAGGRGGGAIFLNVTGNLILDGRISAEGANVVYGSSGGSVFIIAGNLTGVGNISVKGGNGTFGAEAGAGGRIAVYYNTTTWTASDFLESNVNPGFRATTPSLSTAGTLIFVDMNKNSAFITDGFRFQLNYTKNGTDSFTDTRYDTGTSGFNFTNLTILNANNVISNATAFGINVSDTLTLTNSSLTNITYVNMSLSTLIITNSSIDTLARATNAFVINATTVTINNSNITSNLNLTSTNLTVSLDSIISADGKGYLAANSSAPGWSSGKAASHGGQAGGNTKLPYGSSWQPTTLGSGTDSAGANGGGAVYLKAGGTLELDGRISAEGANVVYGSSGGSVLIIANNLTGTGNISAKGGNGTFGAEAGAGGRIAVYYNTTTWTASDFLESNVNPGFRATTPSLSTAGTLIFVDMNKNSAFITDGFRFQLNYTDGTSVFSDTRCYTGASGFNFTNLTIVDANNVAVNISQFELNISDTLNLTNANWNATNSRINFVYNKFVGMNDTYANGFNLSLEKINTGKIRWLTSLSNVTNLTTAINISSNSAYVNSTAITGLNQSANISLYNTPTSFVSPVMLRDGVVCNSTTTPKCFNFTSLNSGNVTFNVSSWTTYQVGESLDLTAPNATILTPQNATITNNSNQNFTLNVSDNQGLANATLKIYNQTGLYNQTTIQLNGATQAVIGVVVYLVDGVYSWFWNVVDLANNVFSTQTAYGNYTITVDATAPQINFTSPTPDNNTLTTNTSTIINISISEQNLNKFIFNWNGTNETTITLGSLSANFTASNLRNLTFNNGSSITNFYGDNSLVLMMNFDNVNSLGDNAIYAVDVSKYGNNGTVSGAVINSSSGKYNSGAYFDGSNDYIDAGNSNSVNLNSYTLTAWIKSRGHVPGSYQRIFYKGDASTKEPISMYLDDNYYAGNFTCEYYNAGPDYEATGYSLTDNSWHFVSCVRDAGTNIKAYIDGVLVSIGSDAGNTVTVSNDLLIGARTTAGLQSFNGQIDEARVWNRTLSASEIQQQYLSNLNKYDTNKWNFYSSDTTGNYSLHVEGSGFDFTKLNSSAYTLVVNKSYDEPFGFANYTYFGFASDLAGNSNRTEIRTLNVQGVPPGINFTFPTPANNTQTSNTSAIINISISEPNLKSVIFNWNGTNETTITLGSINANFTASNLKNVTYNNGSSIAGFYDNSLVLAYNFENRSSLGESSSRVVDMSKYGNNANVSGAIWNSSGKYGGSYQFSGSGDNIYTNNIVGAWDKGTISVWAKFDTFGKTNQLIYQSCPSGAGTNAMQIRVDNGFLSTWFYGSGWGNAVLTNTTSWYHILLTWNKTGSNYYRGLYVNGVRVDNSTDSFTPASSSWYFYVGGARTSGGLCGNDYPQQTMDGQIDEVRIWNRTFTDDEIQQQYASNLNKYDSDKWSFYSNDTAGNYSLHVEGSGFDFTKLNATDYILNVNKSNLTTGTYTYYGYAADSAGNSNITEVRTLNVDATPPQINFTFPTPANNSWLNVNHTTINVSVSENASSCILAWNGRSSSILGDGSDGVLTVSSSNVVVNNYTYLTGNESAGNITLEVNDSSAFSAGDEILIIQMQNYSNGIAGQYEFANIASINGKNITLSSAISSSYYSGAFDSTTATAAQIVRIPQYTNVIISSGGSIISSDWNGYSGGIAAFRANGFVNVTGDINATGKGFRGGVGGALINGGNQGESYAGKGIYNNSANLGGGGAAIGSGVPGVPAGANGGAGGGYGTNGSDTSSGSAKGGRIYGSSELSNLLLGSGGGAGDDVNEHGKAGGGIIFVSANNISITGNIYSRGIDSSYVTGNGCGSGAGSGGSIYLRASDTITASSGKINATGGGVCVACGDNTGSYGGKGRVRLDFAAFSGLTDPVSYNGTFITNYTMTLHNSEANTWANYTLTNLLENSYNYYVLCNDTAGNSNMTEMRTFDVDFTSPNATILNPQNATVTNNSNQNFTLNVSDNQGLKNATLNIYNQTGLYNQTTIQLNGATQAVIGVVVYLVDGVYNWFWTVVDLANNIFTTQTAVGNYTITTDTIKPGITVYSPHNASYNNATILINFTADSYQALWYYNETGNTTFASPIYETAVQGSHTYIFYANDTAGNLNSTQVTFFVDTIFPIVNITYPQNITYSINVSALNYTIIETNPSKCWYSTNLGATNSTAVNSGMNFTNVISTEGSNIWIVYCNDTAGNLNSTQITFFKDTIKPLIQFATPTTLAGNYSQNWIAVNVTASDSGSGLGRIKLLLYNITGLVNSTLSAVSPLYLNFTNLPDGTYYLNASANDTLGNTNYTETRTIFLDTTAPVISLISPADSYSTADTTITFEYNVSDVSNVTNCSLILNNAVIATNMTITKDTMQNFTQTLAVASYTWSVNCTDALGNTGNSSTRSLTISSSASPSPSSPRPSCSDECSSGAEEKSCQNSTTVKERTCGNYDADSCLEWSNWNYFVCPEKGFCEDGECMYLLCTENWTCSSWSGCANGTQTRSCVDGNDCGTTADKPEENQSCIICEENWKCDWNNCKAEQVGNETVYYSEASNCVDLNNCGTELNKPKKESCELVNGELKTTGCEWNCTSWSDCATDYTLSNLVTEKEISKGMMERECTSSNCGRKAIEKKECDLAIPVKTEKVEWCNETYVEIREQMTNNLVSRVKVVGVGNATRLNIGFIISNFTGYCSYCYDGIKNYDEEGTDCGGSNCPPCVEVAKKADFWKWIIFAFWALLLSSITAYVLYFIYLEKRRKFNEGVDKGRETLEKGLETAKIFERQQLGRAEELGITGKKSILRKYLYYFTKEGEKRRKLFKKIETVNEREDQKIIEQEKELSELRKKEKQKILKK